MSARKKILCLTVLFVALICNAQNIIDNFFNPQLHNKVLGGFHNGLIIDDGILGLIGFKNSEEKPMIFLAFRPKVYDFEMAVKGNLLLEVPMIRDNSLHIIYGNIKSIGNTINVFTKISENAFYEGAVDIDRIDGQVADAGPKKFSFPVGYEDLISPLPLKYIDVPYLTKCEYFCENPEVTEHYLSGLTLI